MIRAISIGALEGFMNKAKATVLFVDDDEIVLGVGRAMLEKIGYNAVTAASVSEAAEIYTQKGSGIGLVILDLKMLGGGGTDAVQRIKKINPRAKILISTGSGHAPEAAALINLGCEGVIEKPFGLEAMSKAISAILAKRPH